MTEIKHNNRYSSIVWNSDHWKSCKIREKYQHSLVHLTKVITENFRPHNKCEAVKQKYREVYVF